MIHHESLVLYNNTYLKFSCFYFFFFQAEDGIRDRNVTGVQTCALPISFVTNDIVIGYESKLRMVERVEELHPRSEERRVGKECRSRWSTDHEKKKIEKRRIGSEELYVRQLRGQAIRETYRYIGRGCALV